MTGMLDREQLRRDLSDSLSAIQRDHDVATLDARARSRRSRALTHSTAGSCTRA